MSYDFNERRYTDSSPDNTSSVDRSGDTDDDYSRIVASPSLHLRSDGAKDLYEFKIDPKLKYDLLDDDTEWDGEFGVLARRYINPSWAISATDRFLISDYYDEEASGKDENGNPDPSLSGDSGRERYWRNDLNLSSVLSYNVGSTLTIGFVNNILRYIDSYNPDNKDYDRYTAMIKNGHRFDSRWSTTTGINFVRGDFKELGVATNEETVLSIGSTSDLREYYFDTAIHYETNEHSENSLSYAFIGSDYDSDDAENRMIHQWRLSWGRQWSYKLSTEFGAGPSWTKIDGRRPEWSGNGIGRITYDWRYGQLALSVEKRYDIDNFSGSDEFGFIDLWEASIKGSHKFFEELEMVARLSYRDEKRDTPVVATEDDEDYESYRKKKYTARVDIKYSIDEVYAVSCGYVFTRQDSERDEDDYKDQRLLLTLSWKDSVLSW